MDNCIRSTLDSLQHHGQRSMTAACSSLPHHQSASRSGPRPPHEAQPQATPTHVAHSTRKSRSISRARVLTPTVDRSTSPRDHRSSHLLNSDHAQAWTRRPSCHPRCGRRVVSIDHSKFLAHSRRTLRENWRMSVWTTRSRWRRSEVS